MSYREAFDALQNGDYPTAATLLEQAARESGYASDIVNHAYTLALHRTAQKTRLADVAFRVGNLMAVEDPASAMDYFQRALVAGLDAERVRRIGALHEEWAAPVGAGPERRPGAIRKVAHVVGCLLSGHAPTQYVRMLAESLRGAGVESIVYTTEWAASWFFNPTGAPQSQDVGLRAETHIAAVDGDFMERAERIAAAIRAAGVDAALYHASLSEQITARVAALRPAPIQINVDHGSEMDLDVFDGRIHLFRNALERTHYGSKPTVWIPLASDIEERIAAVEPVSRQSLGLESASSVSATFGNLYKVSGSGYVKVLVEILRRFPKHFHLFAGSGDVKAIRPALHAAGVLPRVRFMGHMADVAPLLEAVDVYLASFPHSGGHSILEAMGAGKPVVTLGYPPDSHFNSGAELVGIPDLVASNEAAYIDAADRMIRTPLARAKFSTAIRERFRNEFRPVRLGERYLKFFEEIGQAGARLEFRL